MEAMWALYERKKFRDPSQRMSSYQTHLWSLALTLHCSVTLVAEISIECRFPGARLKCRDFIEGNSVGWPRCTWKQFEDGFFEQYRSWPWILSPWRKEFRRWYWALYITLVCHLHVCLSECLSNKISNPWLSPGVTISVFRVSDVPWRAEFNES